MEIINLVATGYRDRYTYRVNGKNIEFARSDVFIENVRYNQKMLLYVKLPDFVLVDLEFIS